MLRANHLLTIQITFISGLHLTWPSSLAPPSSFPIHPKRSPCINSTEAPFLYFQRHSGNTPQPLAHNLAVPGLFPGILHAQVTPLLTAGKRFLPPAYNLSMASYCSTVTSRCLNMASLLGLWLATTCLSHALPCSSFQRVDPAQFSQAWLFPQPRPPFLTHHRQAATSSPAQSLVPPTAEPAP